MAGAAVATAALAHAVPASGPMVEPPHDEAKETLVGAYERIARHYVGEVDGSALAHAAVKAMVEELDADSAFLSPRDYRRLKEDTDGRHSGVGIMLSSDGEGPPVIDRVIVDSPAARAGLASGDRVRAVGDERAEDVAGEPADRFEELLRGAPDTRVVLRAAREGRERDFELVREPVSPPSVEWTVVPPTSDGEPSVGLVAIERFHDGTRREVARALSKIARQGGESPGGVVVDLRGNPGGLLDAAIDVADLFVSDGNLASVRGRGGAVVSEWEANGAGTFTDVPAVVLIDRGTASAAEILAGALQDHDRALVAGSDSYGKGSVQTLFDLPDGSGLRLTTSHYYTPAERPIGAEGLGPDISLRDLAEGKAWPAGALDGRWQRDDDLLVWAVETLYAEEAASGPGHAQEARAR